MSIVSTDNSFDSGVGSCYVCNEYDVEIFKMDCGHWACESCIWSIFKDTPDGTEEWSGCDECLPPEGFDD